MENYILSEINIYPVKSLGGILLNESKIEQRGLQYDRRWVLVDENNRFISQREIHKLCLFRLSFENNGFKITNDEYSSAINIPFGVQSGRNANVTVWDDTCSAIHYSAEADKWISDIIGSNCRLMYMPDSCKREVNKDFVIDNDIVSFVDAFPILILGQSSMDNYNKISGNNFKINRFRPSLVFKGGEAHDEDRWKKFTLNETEYNVIKPCSRCEITTVEQETGIAGKEPLATLAKYRKQGHRILFGMYVLTGKLNENSIVKVGSEIEVDKEAEI